ncbi:hypothetical protein M902_2852 [Bacteriovorax sp. BAL6_X]|uniref:hypothetical protein n=1 Tax=Bacteriovorax sp. BAL6_X TaxID=1201290 RepID=UPI000386B2A2|nr:hypothetical protein [Bacteriovorax sp. BAL6_X]EPZ51198.1 hypothetical protein M902_2852 [Bacteriovorax sp. BAL6_X]
MKFDKKLDRLLGRHFELTFPDFPEDDEFNDWVTELVDYDSYLFGASTAGKVNSKMIKDFSIFCKKLDELNLKNEDDKVILKNCLIYTESLKSIIEYALQFSGEN